MKKLKNLIPAFRFSKGSTSLLCLVIAILVILGYLIISKAPTPTMVYDQNVFDEPYHADEGVWIATGKHYYQKFFLERDFSSETWEDERFGTFGTPNPVLGKYLYGWWLFVNGVVDQKSNIPGYVFEGPLDWSRYEKTMPPPEILHTARELAKWIGIFSILLLFLLVRELSGSWLLGSIVGIMFIFQPQVFGQSQKAMMDIPMLLFSLLALFASSVLLKRLMGYSLPTIVSRLALIGLLYGFAMQIKLNSLLVLITVLVWICLEVLWLIKLQIRPLKSLPTRMVQAIRKNKRPLKGIVLGLIAMGLMISLVFIALNPFLYRNTLDHAKHMFMFGKTVTEGMDIPEESMNNTLSKRWKALINVGLSRSSIMHYWLGLPSLIDKGLAFLGLIFGMVLMYQNRNVPQVNHGFIYLFIWGFIVSLGLFAWVPFRASRWYIPMTPIWAVLEGLGVFFIVHTLQSLLSQFRLSRQGIRS